MSREDDFKGHVIIGSQNVLYNNSECFILAQTHTAHYLKFIIISILKENLSLVYLPFVQLVPWYPAAHAHIYSLIPSEQVPPFLHGSGSHSSISRMVVNNFH